MNIIKVNFQTGQRIKDDPLEKSPNSSVLPLFHCSDYKTSPKCKSIYTYSNICIKCGECGRKFKKDGTLIN